MPPHPDSRTEAIGFKVKKVIKARISRVCERKGISVSEAMNQAVEAWLKLHETKDDHD